MRETKEEQKTSGPDPPAVAFRPYKPELDKRVQPTVFRPYLPDPPDGWMSEEMIQAQGDALWYDSGLGHPDDLFDREDPDVETLEDFMERLEEERRERLEDAS